MSEEQPPISGTTSQMRIIPTTNTKTDTSMKDKVRVIHRTANSIITEDPEDWLKKH